MVKEAVRVLWSPAGLFSGAIVEDSVAGLAAVPRRQFVVVPAAELRVVVVVVVLGLVASGKGTVINSVVVFINIHYW